MTHPTVRIYLACSLDGFIAGPDHDLSWLPQDDGTRTAELPDTHGASGALQYEDFIEGIGALLMGRGTYDVLRGFDVAWPYGERPVLVATHRPLDADAPPTVRAVSGDIRELIAKAKEAAGGRDVYLDGGELIRQAAACDLIDDLTITVAPVAIGRGVPLFAGMQEPFALEIVSHHAYAHGMVQLRARPERTRRRR